MRAWVVQAHGEPAEVLELAEVETPEPGPGMVRVRVHAAGIGLPDVFMCRGSYPLTPKRPFTPGQEMAGTVTAVGPDVDPGLLGTRVMGVTAFTIGHGAFAEEALASVSNLHPVPDDMSDAEAAGFIIPFHTGWIGLAIRGQVQRGETVLVLGASGGSGAAAIQLGSALGARVIAVAGGPEKTAYCEQMGADAVIDHWSADIGDAAKALTDGTGVDVIYDTVGGDAADSAVRAIAREGRHLLIGFASGSWFQPDPARMLMGNYGVLGVFVGAYDRSAIADVQRRLSDLHQVGKLFDIVTRRATFDEVPAAVAGLADRTAMGKSVIEMGGA